jgi:hypothetical protein
MRGTLNPLLAAAEPQLTTAAAWPANSDPRLQIPPPREPRPDLRPDITYEALLRLMQEIYGER